MDKYRDIPVYLYNCDAYVPLAVIRHSNLALHMKITANNCSKKLPNGRYYCSLCDWKVVRKEYYRMRVSKWITSLVKRRDEIFTRWHRCVVNCLRQFHLHALLRRLKLTRGGSRGQPREAWLAWNFQRELWFISFFLRETWLGVPPWNVIGNIYSTWSVNKAPFFTWKNDTNRPKFAYLNDILLMRDFAISLRCIIS